MKAGRRGFYFRLGTRRHYAELGLSPTEWCVWETLVAFSSGDGKSYASRKLLAQIVGVRLATVKRVMKALAEHALVTPYKRPGSKSTAYSINMQHINRMRYWRSGVPAPGNGVKNEPHQVDHREPHKQDQIDPHQVDHFNPNNRINMIHMGSKGINLIPQVDQNDLSCGSFSTPEVKIKEVKIKKERRSVQDLLRSVAKRVPDSSLSLSSFSEQENPAPELEEERLGVDEELGEVRAIFAAVWSRRVDGVDLDGDDRLRGMEAIRAYGVDGVREAIRGHYKLATKDGSQRGRNLRHVFPCRSSGNQVIRHALDHGKFSDLRSEGVERLQVMSEDLEEELRAREKMRRGISDEEERDIKARVAAVRKQLGHHAKQREKTERG